MIVRLACNMPAIGRFDDAKEAVLRVRDVYREIGYDADDAWFEETLEAIGRGEVDRHEHPITDTDEPG